MTGSSQTQNPSDNRRLRSAPLCAGRPFDRAALVQLSASCTTLLAYALVVALAFAAVGCGPPGPPPMMPDAGMTPDLGMTVGGVRLIVAARLDVDGLPWEALEPPELEGGFRLEQLTLGIAGARSPSDRVDLPVPMLANPTRLELVRGPRDLALLGASPATYGRAILDVAPSATDEPSIVLRVVRGELTYLVESRQRLTIDTRCGGDAVQLDPEMLGVLRVSLDAIRIIEPLRELEPAGAALVRVDATNAPEILARIERILVEEWELECSALPDEPAAATPGPGEFAESP